MYKSVTLCVFDRISPVLRGYCSGATTFEVRCETCTKIDQYPILGSQKRVKKGQKRGFLDPPPENGVFSPFWGFLGVFGGFGPKWPKLHILRADGEFRRISGLTRSFCDPKIGNPIRTPILRSEKISPQFSNLTRSFQTQPPNHHIMESRFHDQPPSHSPHPDLRKGASLVIPKNIKKLGTHPV